jgi:hypothetical protein
MQYVVRNILHHVGEKMMKSIAFLLVLTITITLINPINVKASDSDDIVYEVVKNRNPDYYFGGNASITNIQQRNYLCPI